METRTIKLIEARFFQLTLQPMNDSADSCRIIAVSDDYCKLVKWGIKRRSNLMERV